MNIRNSSLISVLIYIAIFFFVVIAGNYIYHNYLVEDESDNNIPRIHSYEYYQGMEDANTVNEHLDKYIESLEDRIKELENSGSSDFIEPKDLLQH